MRRKILYTFLFIIGLVVVVVSGCYLSGYYNIDLWFGQKPNYDVEPINSSLFEDYSNRDSATHTLLDLFCGMEGEYYQGKYHDNELDTIKDLMCREYLSVWKNVEDTTCFNMSIGLYIDKKFPSLLAKRIMLEKIDSVLPKGMYGDLPEYESISLKSQNFHIPDSVFLFLDLWEFNFNRLTKEYNAKAPSITFNQVRDSRGCVVCRKLYEDSRWITYILESSISYHGSCGCPSSADYVTIDKVNGHILSKSDLYSDSCINKIYDQIRVKYVMAAKTKRVSPIPILDGETLMEKANGVALINEGLLIYFHPYNIGCGGEEQYNLILPIKTS